MKAKFSTRLLLNWLTLACLLTGLSSQAQLVPDNVEVIAPGDLLRIMMNEDPDVKFEGEVSAGGTVLLPYLGEFPIANLSPQAAELKLAQELQKDLYQQATLSITLVKKAPGQVYVYGAVKKPGVVNMPEIGNFTVLQLLSEVGGLTSWASADEAFILRRQHPDAPATRLALNLADVFARALPSSDADIRLRANDIVCIPGVSGGLFEFISADKCEVIVVGEVKKPGMIEFAPGEERTLIRAIFKAGGFDKFAKDSNVRVISYGRNQTRDEQVVDAGSIIDNGYLDKDIKLQPGDMIIVPQKKISF